MERNERILRSEDTLALEASWASALNGRIDPSTRIEAGRIVHATHTAFGPATLEITRTTPREFRVRAFGDGATSLLEQAPALCGLCDCPPALDTLPAPFRPLARAAAAFRLISLPSLAELLVRIVLEQLVQGKEAKRAYRGLVRRFGAAAPGPFDGLLLAPSTDTLASLPLASLPPLGVSERKGTLLREIAFSASRIEACRELEPDRAEARLRSFRGIGVWSARQLLLRGAAVPDALPLGDFHLPSLVAYHLEGERRGDDRRMLELLEAARGQRGRIAQWIHYAGERPPRRAPRDALRTLPSGNAPRGWFDR